MTATFNKFDLIATGTEFSVHDIVPFVQRRFAQKDEIYRERADEIEAQSDVLQSLFQFSRNRKRAEDDITEHTPAIYTSTIMQQAINFLQAAKLDPDFMDFQPDDIATDIDIVQASREAGMVSQVMRRKGGFRKAIQEARLDLIRGHAYIQRGWEMSPEGIPVKPIYKHVPWTEMRGKYDAEDYMRVTKMSIFRFAAVFGEKMLKKVALGEPFTTNSKFRFIDFSSSDEVAKLKDTITVVWYWDPSRRIQAAIMGGNSFVPKEFLRIGDDFPFQFEGKGFDPFLERKYYRPVIGYHGTGPIDLLMPLALAETAIVNATLLRAVKAANPIVMMQTNDPEDLRMRWEQHLVNTANSHDEPFFVPDSAMGTKGVPQVLDIGVNNVNMQTWKQFLQAESRERTGIDFGRITEQAKTAFQQQLRKEAEEKVANDVLKINEAEDKKFAMEDLKMLIDTESEFHDLEINVEDEFSDMFEQDGFKPTDKKSVRDIVGQFKDVEFEIFSRLEGVLQGQDALEVEILRGAIQSEIPGSAAYGKLKEAFYKRILPEANFRAEDFVPGGGGGPRSPIEQELPPTVPEEAEVLPEPTV